MSIKDKFSDEEKKRLSYLGSMLSRPNTPFDDEVQRILDEGVPEESDTPAQQQKGNRGRRVRRKLESQ